MLVQSIQTAKAATKQVYSTKRTLRNTLGIRSRSDFCRSTPSGGHTDSVAIVVQIRDKLRAQLKHEEAYAAKCIKNLNEELKQVNDPITRNIFYYRYYCGYKWAEVAAKTGISIAAAKMRAQRYQDNEVSQNAA